MPPYRSKYYIFFWSDKNYEKRKIGEADDIETAMAIAGSKMCEEDYDDYCEVSICKSKGYNDVRSVHIDLGTESLPTTPVTNTRVTGYYPDLMARSLNYLATENTLTIGEAVRDIRRALLDGGDYYVRYDGT